MKNFVSYTFVSLVAILGFIGLTLNSEVSAKSTLVRQRTLGGSGLAVGEDYWRVTGDYLVPANGTLFLPLPGSVATIPNGVIVQDGLELVVTDVFLGGAELVNLVRAAQSGPANQVLVYGDQAVQGYQSSLGVLMVGEAAVGAGIGLRKATQGGVDVVVRVNISGRIAQ